MAEITLKGSTIHTAGNLPEAGTSLPDYLLTKRDLSDVTLDDYRGKNLILNIFPSLDTGVCAASVRRFNSEAANLKETTVLCISRDLPFAHNRFCTSEGIENVDNLSSLRSAAFGEDYGVTIQDGPMTGLFSRAVIVAKSDGTIVYTEQVPEITQEPDYEAALDALR